MAALAEQRLEVNCRNTNDGAISIPNMAAARSITTMRSASNRCQISEYIKQGAYDYSRSFHKAKNGAPGRRCSR